MLYSQKLSKAIGRHAAAVDRLAALDDEADKLRAELDRVATHRARAYAACVHCSADVDRLRREERAA